MRGHGIMGTVAARGGGEAHEDNEHEGNKAEDIEFTWEGPKETVADTPETKTVKMSEMREDIRESVKKITREAREQMRAQVQLVPLVKHDEHGNVVPCEGGLLAEILKTTVHKTEPVANKFVGIFYDPKLSGEPSCRPQVRTCGVRDAYKDLITAMLKRRGEQEDPIGANDLYFLLDGSKGPSQTQFMKPFRQRRRSRSSRFSVRRKACCDATRRSEGWERSRSTKACVSSAALRCQCP